MMDRYMLFRKLMNLVSEDYKVTDANMNNYVGDIEIFGVSPNGDIAITAKLIAANEEVSGDA